MLGKTIAVVPKVMPDCRIAKLITAGNKVPRPMPSASSSMKRCSDFFEIQIYVNAPQTMLIRKNAVKLSEGISGKPRAREIEIKNEVIMHKFIASCESIRSLKNLRWYLKYTIS